MCKFKVGDAVWQKESGMFGIISDVFTDGGACGLVYVVRYHDGAGDSCYVHELAPHKTAEELECVNSDSLTRLIDFAPEWDFVGVYVDPYNGEIKAELKYIEQKGTD